MQLYKGTSTIKLVCVLNLIWTHTIYGQLSPEDAEKIDTFINDLMECRGMPGVALAAVKVSLYIKVIILLYKFL